MSAFYPRTGSDDEDDYYYHWWKGLEYWYNECDYAQAVEYFQNHILVLNRKGSKRTGFLLDPSLGHISQVMTSIEESSSNKTHSFDIDDDSHLRLPVQEKCQLMSLLLFLAGCFLDAGDPSKARCFALNSLKLLLLLMSDSDHEKIFHVADQNIPIGSRIIQELIATYEEDTEVVEAWTDAREIAFLAIEKGLVGWKHPSQRPGFFYSLSATDSNDDSAFKNHTEYKALGWCAKIEQKYSVLKHEFETLLRRKDLSSWPKVGAGHHREGAGSHDASVLDRGDWTEWVLFGSGSTGEHARQWVPRTCALLEELVPDAVHLAREGGGEIIYSALAPYTRIAPHCAPTNLRWTAHLGLRIPLSSNERQCRIRVDNRWFHWEEGKVLVFDDSFEHEVVNDTDEMRVVLLLRFWHPSIPRDLRMQTLNQALEHKELDRLYRYNPPAPGAQGPAVLARGLGQGCCPKCHSTGYESIRCIAQERVAVCAACGACIL